MKIFQKLKQIANLKPNLNKTESNAIKTLQSDDTIIIKEADKGGATVIMNKEHYQEMVETIILDTDYYEKLSENPHKDTAQKYHKLLKKYQNLLTKKELDYLENFEVKISQFYGLPKYTRVKP